MGILTIPLIKNDSFLSHFFIYIIFLLMFTVFNQLSFNTSLLVLLEVKLCDKIIKSFSSLVHVDQPVGSNIRSTCLLLIDHFTRKVRKAYGTIISSKASYSRQNWAQLLLAMVTPPMFSYLIRISVQCVIVTTGFVKFFCACLFRSVRQLLETNITCRTRIWLFRKD